MNKKIEQRNEENLGGNDIRKNDNIDKDFPATEFSFDIDGIISNFKVSPNINSTLSAYLYEFVNKLFLISNYSFTKRRLENEKERTYTKTNKDEFIITDIQNDESENPYKLNWTTLIEEGKVKKIDESKISYLINDNSLQMDININNNNFTSYVQNDTNTNSLIN